MADISIYEPGDPGGDPVFEYRDVIVRPGPIGFAEVILPRWPDQPVGFVARSGDWSAHLFLPPAGRDDETVGWRRTRAEAAELVVSEYHWRYAKVKRNWQGSRPEVRSVHDVLPDRRVFLGNWKEQDQAQLSARSQLHRFLALNRWLFDQPAEIRPYVSEEPGR